MTDLLAVLEARADFAKGRLSRCSNLIKRISAGENVFTASNKTTSPAQMADARKAYQKEVALIAKKLQSSVKDIPALKKHSTSVNDSVGI